MAILEMDLNQGKNEIKNIDFYGGEILGVKTQEGKVYMGVSKACYDIGLTENQKDNEVAKIQKDLVLSKGCKKLPLKFEGQVRHVLCIEKGFIPLWLAKISITPNMQKENPETVERLIKYQLEAKDVLEKAFIKKLPVIPENLSPELQVLINMELNQKKLEKEVAETREQIAVVKETIIDDAADWREWANNRLSAIGAVLGDYRRPRLESYEELERRARCNLDRRLENKISNMKKAGSGKKAVSNTNKLDVIDEDPRLKEIYISIVKEMSIKYL